jgi:hypothetical protein
MKQLNSIKKCVHYEILRSAHFVGCALPARGRVQFPKPLSVFRGWQMKKARPVRGHAKGPSKSDALGMNHGAATARLKKSFLFSLVVKVGLTVCYRCGTSIETARELSIEPKVAWQGVPNARELFFDLDNIAFPHLKCNCAASANTVRVFASRMENTRWHQAPRLATRKKWSEARLCAGLPFK